ncbi:EVE domain-containing protein [Haloferula sp.]|uniref:EVE domain-containing protein n=1 Tax=Haloferula sp. TaxID=2497595 RepID=UPI003C73E4A1
MKYWLIKSEPDVFGIDDLKKAKREPWNGIRNYQARNFMRDEMEIGDLALFYHSNAKPPGVVGIAEVASEPYADNLQFDENSNYHDPKSNPDDPRWMMVDFNFVEKFPEMVSLDQLKGEKALEGMLVTQRGTRLSITPVSKKHFDKVCRMAR